MPPLPGPRPETSELRVLTRTEVTDGVVLAVTVEILQTSRPTDELPPPCPVAERAARGVGNPSTRSRQDELSEIARDRAGSGGQGGKRRSAQQPLSTCSPCPFCHQACSAHGRNPCVLSSSRTPGDRVSPRGGWVTFFRQGGRVSPRVAERVLSFIKALDSAFKTLESCDEKLLHHPQFMPMLFRWLRHHKGGVTAARVSHGLGPGGAGRR